LKGLGMSVLDSVSVDDFNHVLDGADVGIKVDNLAERGAKRSKDHRNCDASRPRELGRIRQDVHHCSIPETK
jgi:hypothetical protein